MQAVRPTNCMVCRLCGLQTVSYHSRQPLAFLVQIGNSCLIGHRLIAIGNLLPRPFYKIKLSDIVFLKLGHIG